VTGYGHCGEIRFEASGHEGARFASWSSTVSNAPQGSGSSYTLPISSNTPPGVYIVTGHGELGCDHVATVVVVRVESIEPDSVADLLEIDDGDGDTRTRIFVVRIAEVMEFPVVPVTVHARVTPVLSESELPSGWTLQGGIGSEKLSRTVSRTILAGASKTEFTFKCGSIDSGFKTTVYVYDARVGLFADEGDLQNIQVGHSWGRYTLDDNTRTDLIDSDYWTYLREIGFFPSTNANPAHIAMGLDVEGDVRLGAAAVGSHWPTGWKEYPIQFTPLSLALPQVHAAYGSPPYYNLYDYNCTDFAIALGEVVNVPSMDPSGVSTPWVFSSWLNSN